jgi:hypothetical protein
MEYCYAPGRRPRETLKFRRMGDDEWYNTAVWGSGVNRRLPVSVYDTSQDEDSWLRGTYAEDGAPFHVTGGDQAGISMFGLPIEYGAPLLVVAVPLAPVIGGAAVLGGGAILGSQFIEYDNTGLGAWGMAEYANNRFSQFWPTRSPDASAATIGAVKPITTTACTAEKVNGGRCTIAAGHRDQTAKLRMRPVMCTLDGKNRNDHSWGFFFRDTEVCLLGACVTVPLPWDHPADPRDSIGRQDRGNALVWNQVQNWPAFRAEGKMVGAPCEVPSSRKHSCATVVRDLPAEKAKGDASAYKDVIGQFPCPLPDFATRLGEATIPYNLMSALPKVGGARDTPNSNFYTCEYPSNAIEGVEGLRKFVEYLKAGEVAPCCFAPSTSTQGGDAGTDRPDSCWYVPHDNSPPFQTGVPDDFAAGFVSNFTARINLTNASTFCGQLHLDLVAVVEDALNWYAIDEYPNVKKAFVYLSEVLRKIDAVPRDCKIAQRLLKGELVPAWGPWGDLNGEPGKCSVQRTTLNTRLECGTGIQKRSVPIVQETHCGGALCPPFEQYRFCRRSCTTVYGEPTGRQPCMRACDEAKRTIFDNCVRAFSGGSSSVPPETNAQCLNLVDTETSICQQRCMNAHPDFECSSNLCLTTNRCDPFEPSRCWKSPAQIEDSWDF